MISALRSVATAELIKGRPGQPRRWQSTAILLALPCCFILLSEAASAAEIVVSWHEVQEEVRPKPHTAWADKSLRLDLQGGSAISQTGSATDRRGKSSGGSASGQLGTQMKKSTWQVQDSKTLVRTQDQAQQIQVVRVRTTSDNTCSAEVSYHLKPGFREYLLHRISNNEEVFYSSLRAENVSCRIGG